MDVADASFVREQFGQRAVAGKSARSGPEGGIDAMPRFKPRPDDIPALLDRPFAGRIPIDVRPSENLFGGQRTPTQSLGFHGSPTDAVGISFEME